MNLKRSIPSAVAACIVVAATPLTSEAKSPANAAVDACVKSFVAAYLPDRKIRPVKYTEAVPGPIAFFWAPRNYTVDLAARGADSGELIAEARCVASRIGVVVVLEAPDLTQDRRRADFVVALR